MARLFWLVVGTLASLWILQALGLVPGPLEPLVRSILGFACMFSCPLFFLALYWAPGLFRELTDSVTNVSRRIGVRRREMEDLRRKIAHMDKAHHMAQLGNVYLRQGRVGLASEWFQKALDKESELLDARYKLALCHFDQGNYRTAVELLEGIHAEKPEHDYGMAYLRLAQSHQRLGNVDRAEEIYETLMKFYPGHAEGSYHFALLKASQSEPERAHKLMRDLIASVRLSPRFQRRRNRHWLLKAHWWLWRN